MRLFKVIHETHRDGRYTTREFLAEEDDAWYLWYWLTEWEKSNREKDARMAANNQETLLSLMGRSPDFTVTVRDLDGHVVRPERGIRGMCEWVDSPVAGQSTADQANNSEK